MTATEHRSAQPGYAAAVAAEVRAEMGRKRVSGSWVADVLGLSRMAAGRRINGDMPWNVAELEAIAVALEIPINRLLPQPADSPAA